MKKTILCLALMGCGAMGWAQNTTGTTGTGSTTNGTNSSTTTGSTTTGSTTTTTDGTSTDGSTPSSTNTNSLNTGTNTGTNNLNTGTNNLNTGTNTGTDLNSTSTPPNSGTTTGSMGTLDNTGVPQTSPMNSTSQLNTGTSTNTQLSSTGNYAAYGNVATVPGNLSMSLQRDYPTAFSPTWQQAGDWYRASFNNMNRNIMVYYAPNGNNYSVALPVVSSFVPEEMITRALQTYGNNLYSINRMRGAGGMDVFQATLIENGVSRTEFFGEDGTPVAATDVFLRATDDATMAAGSEMNNGSNTGSTQLNSTSSNAANADLNGSSNMSSDASLPASSDMESKTKIKDANGKTIQKTKMKEGKTKVKGDGMNGTSNGTSTDGTSGGSTNGGGATQGGTGNTQPAGSTPTSGSGGGL